ncbi:hypothetical protein PVL29_014907 [Vitis rotundifolia]|uniref:Uncharacterized protein n=1 Tax=Vitis rotundifolia TaxID=103349 RepID=A0AA39DMK8_VITRO|nr:hypothetical protein PVL29_014907 [Vitis rotundifolia]
MSHNRRQVEQMGWIQEQKNLQVVKGAAAQRTYSESEVQTGGVGGMRCRDLFSGHQHRYPSSVNRHFGRRATKLTIEHHWNLRIPMNPRTRGR